MALSGAWARSLGGGCRNSGDRCRSVILEGLEVWIGGGSGDVEGLLVWGEGPEGLLGGRSQQSRVATFGGVAGRQGSKSIRGQLMPRPSFSMGRGESYRSRRRIPSSWRGPKPPLWRPSAVVVQRRVETGGERISRGYCARIKLGASSMRGGKHPR